MARSRELTRSAWRDDLAIDRTPDDLDEVQQAIQRELAIAATERDAALASEVRLALDQFERGEYGKCVRCHRRIDSRRLKAVPWANRCLQV